ncbi:MAG: serine/threonine-protein phosphatase [Planctomycetota bacterium]|nr:MAG: serine/threonine-protein phosphatase [Planctomycetota bacterium]
MEELPIHIGYISWKGRRAENQDSFYCDALQGHIQVALAVADGMGGEQGGDVASQIAIQTFRQQIENLPSLPLKKWRKTLHQIYQNANQQILQHARTNPLLDGMGTTLVSALVVENHLIAANVGDSRLYHIHGNQVKQISKDHNMLEEIMSKKNFSIQKIQNKKDYYASTLLRSLGEKEKIQVDFFPPQGNGYELQPGDIYLLCSDGLVGNALEPFLSAQEIAKICANSSSAQKTCHRLAQTAYQNGSDDNITAVLLKVGKRRRKFTGSFLSPPTEPIKM